MSINRFAQRYAKAFIEQAKDNDMLENIKKDTHLLLSQISLNRDFLLFLRSPIILRERKIQILEKIFVDKVSKETIKFIKLIAQHSRETYIKEIFEQVEAILRSQAGIITAKFISAIAIDQQQRTEVINYTKKIANSNGVELEVLIDESVIGGFALQFEDKLLDATVASKLSNMKSII